MGKEKKLTRVQEGAKCGNAVSVLRMTKEDKINKILELQSGSQKFDNNINNNSNRIFRAAAQEDVDIINSIKKKYNAGKTRNAACAMGNINGENIELECISGKFTHDNYYNKGNFEPPLPENYHYKGPIPEYTNHTEQKIIEYLRVKYKDNPNVTGEIEIISERIFCDNCKVLLDMFEKEFPNIKVTRVEIVK